MVSNGLHSPHWLVWKKWKFDTLIILENQNQKDGADDADSDDDIKEMMIWASVVWAVGYCYDIREAAAGAKLLRNQPKVHST